MEHLWTLTELTARAAKALAVDAPAQVSGRVHGLPGERMIRWYTTIGLIDPPATRRGRVALYGPRHLLQLVAVKRRQAAGRTLTEIQAELAGASDDTLHGVARLAVVSAEVVDPAETNDRPRTTPGHDTRRFWAHRAAAPSPGPTTPEPRGARPSIRPSDTAHPDTAPPDIGHPATDVHSSSGLVHGIRLAPGATLLLGAPAPPDSDDLAAVRAAAAPLIEVLAARGLLTSTQDTPTSERNTQWTSQH